MHSDHTDILSEPSCGGSANADVYAAIKRGRKIAVFLPAYKAAATLQGVYERLPHNFIDYLYLVDDCSSDDTVQVARDLGLEVYRNERNLGYGGNVKRCIEIGLQKGADVIIEMHPDGEYGTDGIIPSVDRLVPGSGMVLGNRFTDSTKALRSGMWLWKYVPSVILSRTQSLLLGQHITDLHQGFRVYTRAFLDQVPWQEGSNGYLFSFEIIVQCRYCGLRVEEVPVACCYTGEKRGASFKDSLLYSLYTFRTLSQFLMSKLGISSRLFPKRKKGLDRAK